ncbi:MAG: exodeoxyribonuclease VII small subunit [Candidatus Saccharibacteria bacterium]|nr:exodeoxyribonuclease VII small subunit [Candidatus Saccharibacteria bacterium]
MSEAKTINQKIKDLDDKTGWFYSDEFTLDQSAKKYKEAIDLAKDIQKDLEGLKNEVEVLSEDFTK